MSGCVLVHFHNLIGLRTRLRELVYLHDRHPQLSEVGLSLEQYETETTIQGTPQNIPLALLDRVEHTNELEDTVREHVLPCCQFLNLDIDHLLSKYVDELARQQNTPPLTEDASDEKQEESMLSRLLLVVRLIGSSRLRCR
jgi:hypothetical protein